MDKDTLIVALIAIMLGVLGVVSLLIGNWFHERKK